MEDLWHFQATGYTTVALLDQLLCVLSLLEDHKATAITVSCSCIGVVNTRVLVETCTRVSEQQSQGQCLTCVHLFKSICQQWTSMVTDCTLRWHVADISSAEVGSLVHVNPEAIKRSQVMEGLQLVCPVFHSSLAQEVREVCCSRPHLSPSHPLSLETTAVARAMISLCHTHSEYDQAIVPACLGFATAMTANAP